MTSADILRPAIVAVALVASAVSASAAEPSVAEFLMDYHAGGSRAGVPSAWGLRLSSASGDDPAGLLALLLPDGRLGCGIRRPGSSPPEGWILFAPVSSEVSDADARITALTLPGIPYALDDRIASGNVEVVGALPVGGLSPVVRAECSVPAPPAGEGADGEDLEAKVEKHCPDGNCTEFLRDSLEVVIGILRASGYGRAADLLQEILDKERICVDSERRFSPPGECNVTYVNPLIGPKKVHISPECLCRPDVETAIALGQIALKAKNGIDFEEGSLVLVAAAFLKFTTPREREKTKQAFRTLKKVAMIAEGREGLLACLMEVFLRAFCYDPKRPEASLRAFREKLEKLEEADEWLQGLSEEELAAYVQFVRARLERIIFLATTGMWAQLALEFGISRDCLDPSLFDVRRSEEGIEDLGTGSPAAGDMDGDGIADAAGVDTDQKSIGVAPGLGDGLFGPAVRHPVAISPRAARAGDLDGDSRIDLAAAGSESRLALLLSRDGGTFAEGGVVLPGPAEDLAVGDVDANGRLDLVSTDLEGHRIVTNLNVGGAVFTEPTEMAKQAGVLPLGARPGPISMGDLDGDGDLDAVVLDAASEVLVLRNAGSGGEGWRGLEPAAGAPLAAPGLALDLGDLDRDGRLDAVVSGGAPGGGIAWLRGNGTGGLEPLQDLGLEGAAALVAADLDGDGRADIVAARPLLQEIAIVLSPASAGAAPPLLYPGGASPSGVAGGDLDGDGDPDLLSLDEGTGDATVLLNLFAPEDRDCDGNGEPDACEIERGEKGDCDASGVPDACEIEAGIATDADGDGAPDGCGGRFVLSGQSLRIDYDPALGEPSAIVPLRLSQIAPGPLGVSAVALALGHDPLQLAAGPFEPSPDLAALIAEGRALLTTALLEDLVLVEVRFHPAPEGAELPLAVPDLVLGSVRYTTLDLAAGGGRLGAFLDWRALPASTSEPGLSAGIVLAAGGIFRTAGEDIGLLFEPPPGPPFRRGDSNSTAAVDISDAVFTLGWLFLGGEAPSCVDSADVNDDGTIDISDPVNLLGYLFLGLPAPPPPGAGACGDDPTPDGLGACEYPPGACG